MMGSRHTVIDSALGELTLVADGAALTGLYFPHHWYKPSQDTFGPLVDAATDRICEEAHAQLAEYLDGTRTDFDLPTATHGDPFSERVWALLGDIPYGRTTTYGELAGQLGDKTLAQEVGQAVGHNPLSVIVPCHRVLGQDGKLTGYAGGLARKRFLLNLEAGAHVLC